jgi:phosphonate transport system ATP-binding protein
VEICLQEVSASYGSEPVLRQVSLRLAAGEQAAIIGPSGSGKSTLFKLLTLTTPPTTGIVEVGGHDLAKMSARGLRRHRSGVGVVQQQLGLVPNLRVAANLAIGRLGLAGFWGGLRQVVWPSRVELAAMRALLQRVGMTEFLHKRVDQLSGGQQQRVAIARALWQQPKLLVADEPVSSLDPMRAREVLTLLTGLARQENLLLVVSLHQFELAKEFFPRLIGLREGRVLFDKASEEVGEVEYRRLFEI